MALVLDIREADRIRLVEERSQAQNSAQPIERKHVLTAKPCPYLNDGKIDEDALALKLVEIILLDRPRFFPLGLWKGDSEWEKNNRRLRAKAMAWINCEDQKRILETLNGELGIRNLLREGKGKFTTDDLLSVDTTGVPENNTMVGLARRIETISKTVRSVVPEKQSSWCALILDLGEAAIQCRRMDHFIRISVHLFSAVVKLLKIVGGLISEKDTELVKDIAIKYLRNYVAVVLLAESMSDGGEN